MLGRFFAIGLVLTTATVSVSEAREIAGMWSASISDTRPGKLSFSLRYSRNDNSGSLGDLSDFEGLTSEQIGSKTRVPVEFELQREAGAIHFEGLFKNGEVVGEFAYTPNEDFPRVLRSLGVEFAPKDGERDRELFQLALFDVSSAFIRSMQAIGYDESLERYVEFRIFGVDPGYVRDMAAVGFPRLAASKLVETRIHGATPEYIRTMRASGEDLTLDQYIESRIFQVTPEFANEMRAAGYPNLSRDRLVEFRIHGVSPEFIESLRKLGYRNIPADQLVAMRIHGVTPEFIRRVEAAGYHLVPVEKLVQMRIFDIDPKMVRALDDAEN